ncbi:HNH endonuclease [Actinomadura sp. GC306]|uniref:HNH endonuclease signature motif containing protein n=1 Tax=Actinomadura sp. GC306 TaxID=2530367 RepID=UPI00105173F8|nr:HNH endonuclease signature motif containing protein [Actinomadura sp. GC306]TDC65906.1 HNH endonuclease [Actinomadura sp. GC306]
MAAVVGGISDGRREWEGREWFPPGPQLAICLSGEKGRLDDLTDDELLQVAAAARRQTSWAQARELAAIAELTRRRTADEDATDPDHRVLSGWESVTEEVAAALTVTSNTAATLVHLAERLTGPLAETGEALGAGRLDMAKARVICDVTDRLPEEAAGRVERAALETASGQTTGQLRRRIRRIAQRLAPEAIEERRREAARQRRLELWDTPSGTTDLALCDLATEDAHAIYNKITAAAHGIKADGDTRPLSAIRADLAAQLLHGAELPEAIRVLLTQTRDESAASNSADASGHPADCCDGASSGRSGMATTRATMPGIDWAPFAAVASGFGERSALRTEPGGGLAGGRDGASIGRSVLAATREAMPGVGVGAASGAAVSGPCEGSVPRTESGGGDEERGGDTGIAVLADEVERRLRHVQGRVPPRELPSAVRQTVQRIHRQFAGARDAACQGDDEVHGRPGYRPSAAMRREVEARHPTCVFPTCNQPSHRCDLDHTVPWQPGITCRCNLAPLCRRHHRLKQRTDWRLFQVWAGLLIWVTPSGAWYLVRPERQ